MLWTVTLNNGESRVVEADEVDVGPAGELRFSYETLHGDEYRTAHHMLAPGVWYEVAEEAEPSEDQGE